MLKEARDLMGLLLFLFDFSVFYSGDDIFIEDGTLCQLGAMLLELSCQVNW